MTFESAQHDPRQAQAPTESFVTPSRPAAPVARKQQKQLTAGVAGIIAAAALVVGGSAGYVIGHSSGSGSQVGPGNGQMGPGGMGGYGGASGYGPMGGQQGGPGGQQDSTGTS